MKILITGGAGFIGSAVIRYEIDASKIARELNWMPQETFESGLRKTIEWYLSHQTWCGRVLDGSYALQRLGRYNENNE